MPKDIKFVMKIGATRTGTGPTRFEELVRLGCDRAKIPSDRVEFLDGEEAALLTVASAEKADQVIEALLELARERVRRSRELRSLHVHVGVAAGSVVSEQPSHHANSLFQRAKEEAVRPTGEDATPHSEVLITHDVYNGLPAKHQDAYRPSEAVNRLTVHRRFANHLPRCFVVSPIGESGSADRKRADEVYETYIKPACEGVDLRPVRGEQMSGNKIVPEIEEALHNDPLVVAYLGPGARNPNVIWELGYRSATGLPVVVLRDEPQNGDEDTLPFDLKDVRFVDLPLTVPDQGVGDKIRTIRSYIQEALRATWQFARPYARVNVNTKSPEKSRFVEASQTLEELFEYPGLAGASLGRVIEELVSKMPETQRQPFLEEQGDLIQRLATPDPLAQGTTIVKGATVPLVFAEHAKYHGRAFLPVIVQSTRLGELLRMKLVYLDVTNVARMNDEGYYTCLLAGKIHEKLLEGFPGSEELAS